MGPNFGIIRKKKARKRAKMPGRSYSVPPLFLKARSGEIVEELLACGAGLGLHDFVLLRLPGDFGHLRNDAADCVAERAECKIDAEKDIFEFDPVGLQEGAFKYRLRYFESDEVVVRLGRIVLLCDVDDVEGELGFQVGRRGLLIGNNRAELLLQLGYIIGTMRLIAMVWPLSSAA